MLFPQLNFFYVYSVDCKALTLFFFEYVLYTQVFLPVLQSKSQQQELMDGFLNLHHLSVGYTTTFNFELMTGNTQQHHSLL